MEEIAVSLLQDAMTKCQFLDRRRVSDGEGGMVTEWTEGEMFDAAIVLDSSMQARIAQVQGVTAVYTVTTGRNLTLEYHEVFKRLSDGKIFRVTSDGDDKATPPSTRLNMRQVSAEEWTLPA